MNNTRIGWIGLGNMGMPMATNLLKAGMNVTVYNRDKNKTAAIKTQGAAVANSIKELASSVDVIVTMVSDDEAVKQIYTAPGGILNAPFAGRIAIDMSTVSPATSRSIAELCNSAGCMFLDAPVSGSVKPAQDGTLIILVGGPHDAYHTAKPLFEVLGKMSLHLGDNGSGSTAKLAINYLLGLHLQGLAETVLFAQQNGIGINDMLAIINESAVGNAVTQLKSANLLHNDYKAAFALKHLTKDLRLAGEQGLQSPLYAPLYQSYQQALEKGLGEEDAISIINYLRKF